MLQKREQMIAKTSLHHSSNFNNNNSGEFGAAWSWHKIHLNCHYYNLPTITAISWPPPWISHLFSP